MKLAEVLSEAWRNVVTGTTRVMVFALSLAFVVGGLASADARTVLGLQERAAEFVDSGASVRVLNAHESVRGAACESLTEISGIAASGALAEGDPLTLDAMPDHPLPVFRVTPGLAAVLGVRAASAEGVWISTAVAERLGVGPGQVLDSTAGELTVAGVFDYPDDGRDNRPRQAVLVPEHPDAEFDQCWADVRPPGETADDLILWAAVPGEEVSVTVGQLNTTLGTSFDAASEFGSRITRWSAPAAALAGLLLGFVAIRLRRLEMAGALHVGVSRRALAVGTAVETAVWSLAGAVLALCALVVVVTAASPGVDPADAFGVAVRGVPAAVLSAQLGAFAAMVSVRESHLFRYFKDR